VVSTAGWDMSKDVIDMACEKSRWELLAEVISHVHRCRCIIYSFEGEKISFYPFRKSKESNVHVSSAWRRFLGIRHCGGGIIVFIEKCSAS